MKAYQFQTQVWLPHGRAQIFKFFADPMNLNHLTPPWLHFEILTPRREVCQGTLLDYRLASAGHSDALAK